MTDEMESEAGPLALGPDPWVGQPDRWHEVPPTEFGQHPGIDPVGLAGERCQPLDALGVGDQDIPAGLLELVVDEAGAIHRFDRRPYCVTVPGQPLDEHPERVCVGADGDHLDRPSRRIEHVDVDSLARQVQSGVQHVWASRCWFR